jgi:hypothetical protein
MALDYLLLTGAGFSKNWGGWLAADLWSVILSHPFIQNNETLKKVVWNNRDSGFETIFDDKSLNDKNKKTFQDVVKDSFIDMHGSLIVRDNMMQNLMIRKFIGEIFIKFNGYFTLNQDLFFEQLYNLPHDLDKWYYPYIDNIQTMRDVLSEEGDGKQIRGFIPKLDRQKLERITLRVGKDLSYKTSLKPYYKLHGSLNFKSDDGKDVMIIGSSKASQINGHKLIEKYFDDFSTILNKAKKLMIIGYSFKDNHVNQIIFDAVENSDLKLWIIGKSDLNSLIRDCAKEDSEYKEIIKKGLITHDGKIPIYSGHDGSLIKRGTVLTHAGFEELQLENFLKKYENYFRKSLINISNNGLDIFDKNILEIDRVKKYFFDEVI